MTEQTMRKWEQHEFSTGAYTGEDYKSFQRAMRADLNKQLKAVGLTLHSFNKNHYCFSAVVTDGTRFAYISMEDVRGKNYSARGLFGDILYRTMAHEKDWTGGTNNFCHWNEVGERCKYLLDREARVA